MAWGEHWKVLQIFTNDTYAWTDSLVVLSGYPETRNVSKRSWETEYPR